MTEVSLFETILQEIKQKDNKFSSVADLRKYKLDLSTLVNLVSALEKDLEVKFEQVVSYESYRKIDTFYGGDWMGRTHHSIKGKDILDRPFPASEFSINSWVSFIIGADPEDKVGNWISARLILVLNTQDAKLLAAWRS